MKMASLIVAGFAVGLLLTRALGAGPDFAAMQVQPYDPPKTAPLFVLPDVNGATVRLDDLKGRVVMLVFWTTW